MKAFHSELSLLAKSYVLKLHQGWNCLIFQGRISRETQMLSSVYMPPCLFACLFYVRPSLHELCPRSPLCFLSLCLCHPVQQTSKSRLASGVLHLLCCPLRQFFTGLTPSPRSFRYLGLWFAYVMSPIGWSPVLSCCHCLRRLSRASVKTLSFRSCNGSTSYPLSAP